MNDEDRKAFDRWLDDWCQAGGFAPSIESTWQAALEYARKWRPISEPLDNPIKPVLLHVPQYGPHKPVIIGELSKTLGWLSDSIKYGPFKPTHWQPLPEPPQ